MKKALRAWRVRIFGLACTAALWISLIDSTVAISLPIQRARAIPRPVLCGAETLVVQRVGKPFFQKHMALDFSASRFSPGTESTAAPHWTVVYRVRNNKGAPNAIDVEVDGSGRPFGDQPVRGALDCVREPTACEFALDEGAARSAARKAGLAPGITPWNVQFQFVHGSWQRYAWTVLSTQGDGCNARGESYMIDPNTGRILEKSEWFTICCPAPEPMPIVPDTIPGPVQR